MSSVRWMAGVLLAGAVIGGCADDDGLPEPGASPAPTGEQRHPDVVDVEVSESAGKYRFDVTISSPYDTPERYADGWRIKDDDGTVYGEHTLAHDHADEQPFTRTQDGVEIPNDVDSVIVEGRDRLHGYGGQTQTVELP